jgi:hypothetical protein
MAPLAIPAPGLARFSLLEPALAGFEVAGETAASPVVVVEPVLAFCASAIEFAKSAAPASAMMANFMLGSSGEAAMKTTAREVSSLDRVFERTAGSQPVHRTTVSFGCGRRYARWMMSNSSMAFDPIGTVVDWIDACRQRSLAALVDLYDDAAKVDCCEGGSFRGKSGVERYWLPKLKEPVPGAFAIDALLPEAGGVSLDYRDHDGRSVRTHFRFSETGKIISTACAPT